MTIRVSDPVLFAAMSQATQPITVEGPDGQRIGTFNPEPLLDPKTIKPAISEEELRRRETDPGIKCYTTAEVLAHLRSL